MTFGRSSLLLGNPFDNALSKCNLYPSSLQLGFFSLQLFPAVFLGNLQYLYVIISIEVILAQRGKEKPFHCKTPGIKIDKSYQRASWPTLTPACNFRFRM